MNRKSTTMALTAALLTLALQMPAAKAQSVIFPQTQQAGTALLEHSGSNFVLKNQLLTATFTLQGQQLRFGGCPEMDLKAGTELFELRLGNGSQVIKSSEMTLVGGVKEINYTANDKATRGAEKLAGKAIEATFTKDKLTVTWRAILRDGSHYIRTEIELKASENVKMNAVLPMLYEVDAVKAKTTPKVVGNTRGAVLLSDKIFAGLETPTGKNSVGGLETMGEFSPNSWTDQSFSWTPGEAAPQELLKQFKAEEIAGTRGYVNFKEKGEQHFTFTYKGGTHRLNIIGVDAVNLKGEVVAKDYHKGFAGGSHGQNKYTLNIPEAGVYTLRYFVETKTETITSSGQISLSKPLGKVVVVNDLLPGSKLQYKKAEKGAAPTETAKEGSQTMGEDASFKTKWAVADWKPVTHYPSRVGELGYEANHTRQIEIPVYFTALGVMTTEFQYKSGNHALNLVGVDLLDAEGKAVAYDYHKGKTGTQNNRNTFQFNVPFAGNYTLRFLAQSKDETIESNGVINVSLQQTDTLHLAAAESVALQGLWSRNTTLLPSQPWKVSSVVGLVAKDQPRRSFLAYSERERAVPWRAMPAYISWYELNIDRNNDRNYTGNMHDYQCEDVVREWKKQLYDRYKTNVNSFVWDDGWDFYGPWTFNKNFPNGFAETDRLARAMGSGIGAWLGPVGGYGQSGNYRRAYWNGKGGMQLSNPAYYKAFTDAITDLCNKRGYDFRFFKFDGISDLFSATGPKNDANGDENAEGIINAERMVRETIKPDIFFNTTVGTWASPFWFHYTDAVWRQENDYGEIGNQGTDREKWITYRDRLVYQNFVQNSPICPINTLMTHGFILSDFGNVSKSRDYDGIVRELRCAFACGSGMVELYNDYALMNRINGGRLWGDLAECLQWQKNNADVLPDAHWVGGNPWTGSKAEVYGWASWNGPKATLALRNPATTPQVFKTTLRKALEVPAHVTDTYIFTKAFGNQSTLEGFQEGQAINLDTELTLTLPASSVFVFDGRDSKVPAVATTGISFENAPVEVAPGQHKALVWFLAPTNATDKSLQWTSENPEIATIKDGVVYGVKEGEATLKVTTSGGQSATIKVQVKKPLFALNFDANANTTNKGRELKNLVFTLADGKKMTYTMPSNKKAYVDLTTDAAQYLKVEEGGTIVTSQVSWLGSWMHAYFYLDADQSGQFEVEKISDPELVACSYYHNEQKNADGVSAQSNNNPGMSRGFSFKAPEKAGRYRLRFKIDWDNIDAGGSIAEGNSLLSNDGKVVDILVEVVNPSGIKANTANATTTPQTYNLSGRQTSTSDHGVYIVNGRKVVK